MDKKAGPKAKAKGPMTMKQFEGTKMDVKADKEMLKKVNKARAKGKPIGKGR